MVDFEMSRSDAQKAAVEEFKIQAGVDLTHYVDDLEDAATTPSE